MKHIKLKFTHGMEVGARLAYLGHYRRTKDEEIFKIAEEEALHQIYLKEILEGLGTRQSLLFDIPFAVIGSFVYVMCQISPEGLLNVVARLLEKFAVFSYRYLAKQYPYYEPILTHMADIEEAHEDYFKK